MDSTAEWMGQGKESMNWKIEKEKWPRLNNRKKQNFIFSGFIEIRLTIRNRIYFYKWFGVLI